MERVNIQFEESMIKKGKLIAALENKSFPAVVRDAMSAYLETKKDVAEQVRDILYMDDDAFDAAVSKSFEKFDGAYKKLAE